MNPIPLWDSLAPWFLLPATPCRGFSCLLPVAVADGAGIVYSLAVFVLSAYGLNALAVTVLFLLHMRRGRRPGGGGPMANDRWPITDGRQATVDRQLAANTHAPSAGCATPYAISHWPTVTVQLPIYNEALVVERVIDAACALDYPVDRLTIQVLDDSTDGTTALARARVAYHAARGAAISLIRRPDRSGYKAGALAAGLASAPGEFIAVFDADFMPAPDFLRRLMPHFTGATIGAVQARWGHLNAEYSPITRAQALLLDGHFVVEQTARYRSGLFLNFNGSAGVWRRATIESAGGWQADTLAEDMDLSYRAQLQGWQICYLPDLVAPAEIPLQVMALKSQQFRWAKGSIQCLRKLAGPLLRAPVPALKRLEGFLHLSAYLMHPAMILLVLSSLPVVLTGEINHLPLGIASVAGLGAPLMFAVAQWAAYRNDWGRRFAYFIFIVFLGSGLALNNTWAILEAVMGRNTPFHRTPKFRVEGRRHAGQPLIQGLAPDWTTWGELALGLYATAATLAAFQRAPALAPFLCLYAASFIYTALTTWWQAGGLYSSARIVSRKSSAPPLIR